MSYEGAVSFSACMMQMRSYAEAHENAKSGQADPLNAAAAARRRTAAMSLLNEDECYQA
jgi:hypothetical protein